MSYYLYRAAFLHFYGDTLEGVRGTVHYCANQEWGKKFGLPVPSKGEIQCLDNINIHWVWPISCEDHFFSINLSGDIHFKVNANAYDHLLSQLDCFEDIKEGYKEASWMRWMIGKFISVENEQLYRFANAHYSNVWLPESVVAKMKNYDWEQHKEQVKLMNESLEAKLGGPRIIYNEEEEKIDPRKIN